MQTETTQIEFCNVEFKELLERAAQCKVNIVGIIKSVFTAKKFIIEVTINEQIFIRTIKKFNQFQATYEVIKMKFQNFDMGDFPSKYQVFGKDETRKIYFQSLMNKIVQNYVHNPQNQASKRLFSILYLFLTRSMAHKQMSLKTSNLSSQSLKSFEKKRKLSLNEPKTQHTECKQNDQCQNSHIQWSDRKPTLITQYEKQRHKLRRNSIGSFVEFCVQDQSLEKNSQNKQLSIKTSENLSAHQTKLVGNFEKKKNLENYFQIKFQNQQGWRRRYLKIQNSSLLIFKDRMENHFRTRIQLYRIDVEFFHRQMNIFDHFCQKMEINNEPLFPQDQSVITLSHEYDFKKFFIRGLTVEEHHSEQVNQETIRHRKINEQLKLQHFADLIRKASQISPIQQKFEGVFNPIGKIFLVIHKLIINGIDREKNDILKIRIRTFNLEYQCKKVLLREQNVIKQGFLVPVSSAFEIINIEAIVSRQQGWIRQQFKDFNIGYLTIQFSQILTKPSGHKFQKINVALIKPSDGQNNEFAQAQANLQYSLENYSHFSSIYSESFANQNDGKIISGLKLQDMDELSVTVDRALRIIGNIALFIINFWRNVYLFKYPKLAKLFFTCVLFLNLFAEAKVFITSLFLLLIFIISYNHPKLHLFFKLLIEQFLFSQIHPNFVQPLCLGTTQIKYRKWCQALDQIARQYRLTRDNKLQKKTNLEKQSFIEYKFQVHNKTFKVTEQVKSFLGKVFEGKKVIEVVSRIISGVVNSVEKCCNIFLWIDTKRSLLFLMVLLIFSGIANDFLVRIIGVIFCVHRLYKGMNFYKLKHYSRNRKVAVFTLRYIIKKHFSNLVLVVPSGQQIEPSKNKELMYQIQQRKKIIWQSKSEKDIDDAIKFLQFPLNDENGLKKLKNELIKLIGVYIDIDEIKELNKTPTISLAKIIEIIETCETRLSLDWVPGKQGLSNQFQQLKHEIKQAPLIDVWLEHALINFVLNIPSQMYMKLKYNDKKNDSAKKLKNSTLT